MENILLALPLLACPVGMGLMMWFMSRGMRRDGANERSRDAWSLYSLRAEQAELECEIARREAAEPRDDEFVRSAR
jgi:hypothetical protein